MASCTEVCAVNADVKVAKKRGRHRRKSVRPELCVAPNSSHSEAKKNVPRDDAIPIPIFQSTEPLIRDEFTQTKVNVRHRSTQARKEDPQSTETPDAKETKALAELGPRVEEFVVASLDFDDQIEKLTATAWKSFSEEDQKKLVEAMARSTPSTEEACNEGKGATASWTELVTVCEDLRHDVSKLKNALLLRAELEDNYQRDRDSDIVSRKVDINFAVADFVIFVLATQSPKPKSFCHLLRSGEKNAAFDGLCKKIVHTPQLTSAELARILDSHVGSLANYFDMPRRAKKIILDSIVSQSILPQREFLTRCSHFRKVAPNEALVIDNYELLCEFFNVLGVRPELCVAQNSSQLEAKKDVAIPIPIFESTEPLTRDEFTQTKIKVRHRSTQTRKEDPQSSETPSAKGTKLETVPAVAELGPCLEEFAVACSDFGVQIENLAANGWKSLAEKDHEKLTEAIARSTQSSEEACNEDKGATASLTYLINVCCGLRAQVKALDEAVFPPVDLEEIKQWEANMELISQRLDINGAAKDFVVFVLATQSPKPKSFSHLLRSGKKNAAFDGLCKSIVHTPQLTSAQLAEILDSHVGYLMNYFGLSRCVKKRKLDFIVSQSILPQRDLLTRLGPDFRKSVSSAALIIDNYELICEFFNVLG